MEFQKVYKKKKVENQSVIVKYNSIIKTNVETFFLKNKHNIFKQKQTTTKSLFSAKLLDIKIVKKNHCKTDYLCFYVFIVSLESSHFFSRFFFLN